MIKEWLQYIWIFALSFFTNKSQKIAMGDEKKLSLIVVVSLILWGFFKRLSEKSSEDPSGLEQNLSLGSVPSLPRSSQKKHQPVAESENMALVPSGGESIVKEEEVEQSTETSVSQVRKDLGNTKIAEDSASFQGTHSSKVVEETGSSSQNLECSAKVVKQSSQTVTENRKVTTSKTTKSSSYSFEETGEYEYEVDE